MLLLTTAALPQLREHAHPNLGRLVTPRHYPRIEDTAREGWPWAADNDCFNGLDAQGYFDMLDRLKGLPGCRFVAVPDVLRCVRCKRTVDGYGDEGACKCPTKGRAVYGDARLTARRFEAWAPGVKRRGLPVALVLQDGLENPALAGWLWRTWHRLGAVFVGGSTAWKLGPAAAVLIRDARRRGLWVHAGRVNSARRARYFASVGCHSFDGTGFSRWRNTRLSDGMGWAAAPPQMRLIA